MRAVQRRITGNDNIQSIFVAAREGEPVLLDIAGRHFALPS